MRSSSPDSHTLVGGYVAQANLARARHRSYALLGRLYLDGVTEEVLPTLQQIEVLASHLPHQLDQDEAAAAHYHLFSFNVFAYEAIFLERGEGKTPATLGGAVTERVAQAYRRAGFSAAGSDFSADHIGHELGLLAHLTAAEVDAWEDHRPELAQQLRKQQATFLSEHLLRWLPALRMAIRCQDQGFYAALANLTCDLVEDHALMLLPDMAPISTTSWLLPPPSLLDEQQTGIRELARYLTTPAVCGIYLSRDTLGNIAQHLQLPRGFGSRHQLLENLFHAAAQYDATADLLGALYDIATSWAQEFEDALVESLNRFSDPWQAQAATTCRLLEDMRQRAATLLE